MSDRAERIEKAARALVERYDAAGLTSEPMETLRSSLSAPAAHEAAVRVTASREIALSKADEAALRVPRIPSPPPPPQSH